MGFLLGVRWQDTVLFLYLWKDSIGWMVPISSGVIFARDVFFACLLACLFVCSAVSFVFVLVLQRAIHLSVLEVSLFIGGSEDGLFAFSMLCRSVGFCGRCVMLVGLVVARL